MSDPAPDSPPRRRLSGLALAGLAVLAFAAGAWAVLAELESSYLQARLFAQRTERMGYRVAAGASERIRYPAHGPFDERLGYVGLPRFIQRLGEAGFGVEAQARFSDALYDYTARGYFAPYREKTQAGLRIEDCTAEPLFEARYPRHAYADYAAVPARVLRALLFIENRDLLDTTHARVNPAVDWSRLGRALLSQAEHLLDADQDTPGGSTLATQIEKYRHSPDGITGSMGEKLRQMMSASHRAYLDGTETLRARQRIALDYLNTVPLAALPGYGEVNGLGDGLWAWFGADFARVNALLAAPAAAGPELAAQGLAMRQAVALMVAHRRPSYYLGSGRAALRELTDSYLRLLAAGGIIEPALRDAALAAKLAFRDPLADPAIVPVASGKAVSAVRTRLAGWLDLPLYSVDRLDLALRSSVDRAAQEAAAAVLRQVRTREYARAAGLLEHRLLARGDPAGVQYSFTLLERGTRANYVRVQTDTLDQPLDINEGSKLELGSTAKLRTLVTYLEIVAELRERHYTGSAEQLAQARSAAADPLSQWALDWLIASPERGLPEMLEAALQRRYSADPGATFFTGGGVHTFANFKREDDGQNPTVREALRESINLSFIRMMRDIVRYEMYQVPGSSARILDDAGEPRRAEYLARFADAEGRVFLQRYYRKYRELGPEQALEALLGGIRLTPERLAVIHRSLEPQADAESFAGFMRARLPEHALGDAQLSALYERHAPGRYDLRDRGYIARVHPLELWLVAYLRQHPGASYAAAAEASARERQEIYEWLFSTRRKGAQDSRILTMLEQEAFLQIHQRWKRLGYPFDFLVPSLATAIGSSGDRPGALAELMGIIANDGMRLPTLRVERLHFAAATPYETVLSRAAGEGEPVMAPAVARALRSALAEVVEAGTARRLAGAFKLADGSALPLGGKTGTGDNRVERYGAGGQLLGSRAINRTATFVFYLGARHFGTLTAYVPGAAADDYVFTSALPTQILKLMAPQLMPYLDPTRPVRCRGDRVTVMAQTAAAPPAGRN